MNFIKFILTSAAVLSLITTQGIAQSNFVEGYIVSQDNDTTYGYIDFRGWIKNPRFIRFKRNKEMEEEEYTPSNLKSFHVDNRFYVSRKVRIDSNPRSIGNLEDMPDSRVDTVFLQELVRGETSLFSYMDQELHFYAAHDGRVHPLIHQVSKGNRNGQSIVMRNEEYIEQLKSLFKGCSAVLEIDNLRYSMKPMIELFERYNQHCTAPGVQYVHTQEKAKVSFTLQLGATRGQVSYNRHSFGSSTNLVFDESLNLTLGATLNLLLPGNLGKWSATSELLYRPMNYTYTTTGGNSSETRTYQIGASYLKLNILVRRHLRWDNVQPYLNAGVSNGFAFNTTNKGVSRYGDASSEIQPALLGNYRRYELGGLAGLGISSGMFNFELRYEITDGMAEWNLASEGTTANNFYVLVGYRL
ncbi:outer membrane beta-barrel protein [Aliifodinibius sp. S!AR15-10]|uniref:outer membrane beta-barrel protein n=1 Tax=Aliifodinibius sp. S!AR15-10 TaxID=2950437 RepID=UPI00285825D7|nr:outer membrane beta-barrel protein [Aliifodinibius sp. S!AR15-10]MDR8393136.1 outer membrane beta-barrel protein [Aliifodinibius sp. S!AR15-10]